MKIHFMKTQFIIALVILSFAQVTNAQETKEFIADGIKVLLKPSNKSIVSARLFVKGGTANYTKEKEGIESLAFSMAIEGGTKTKNKNEFNNEAEKLGTRFQSSTSLDHGNLSVTCIKNSWDASWNLFSDAILNPLFDSLEFNKQKEKMIAGIKERQSNPDETLNELAMDHAFAGKNYAKKTDGSELSISKIKLNELRNYFKNTVCKSRCFLVIVGNITEEDIRAKIKTSLAKLNQGKPAIPEARFLITKSSERIVDRKIATNYLIGIMSAPQFNTEDGFPMMMAYNILYDRLFVELRTKRSLSYAPAAYYNRDAVANPYSALYISTTKPKEAIKAIVDVLDSAKTQGITEKELNDQKQTFLTTYYMKLETAEAQSAALGRAEILGNWKLDELFNEKVKATTLKQVNAAIKQYSNAIIWTYLGKKEMVSKTDFIQPKKSSSNSVPY